MNFSDRTRKKGPFNTDIEVTTWAGLTVNVLTCFHFVGG